MNQKSLLAILGVVALVFLGIFFYTKKSAAPSETVGETSETDNNTDDTVRVIEGGTSTEPQAPAPETTIDVSGSASVGVQLGGIKEFVVNASNFAFSPTTMTVKKGDRVKITFKNTGGFHDFVIDEFNIATKQLAANTEQTVEFVADKAGKFEYYCSVGKHREMGMKGTLTVTQ